VRRSINAGEVDPSAHRIKGPRQLARTGGQCAHRGAIGSCSGWFVGNPSVTRPNGQRRVRCGLPVIRPELQRLGMPISPERSLSDEVIYRQLTTTQQAPASKSLTRLLFKTSIQRGLSIHIARQPSGRRAKHVVPAGIPRSGRQAEDRQPMLQG
jgi:hypothetical protein